MDAKTLSAATGAFNKYTSVIAPYLQECFDLYDISNKQRKAAFVAEASHETMGFYALKEIWGPTPTQSRYQCRVDLGNVHPGDGVKYMGRGLFQYTGYYNYWSLGPELIAMLGANAGVPDFILNPEKLQEPRWAVLSAGNYWNKNKFNPIADKGNIDTISKVINGGRNGLLERRALYVKALPFM